MKIGIFGGSFDPIHNGHTNALIETKIAMGLDKIIVIPTFRSPHKDFSFSSSEDRLSMVECALSHFDDIKVSDYEVSQGTSVYTFDTLEHFKNLYPNSEFYLIIGIDQYLNFKRWHRYQDILNMCTVVVISRDCERVDVEPPFLDVTIPIFEASSTLIRERIKKNEPVSHLIDTLVYDYIKRNELYGCKES